MQNNDEITPLQERFDELSEALAEQFQALCDAEAKLERRMAQMHFRQVEMRRYHMHSLKAPVYPVLVEIISALKSIEELLSECGEFNEEANIVTDDIHFELESMHEKLLSSIQKYVDMYRNSRPPFKSAMREAFGGHAELIAWFMLWLDFYEQCEDAWGEDTEIADTHTNTRAFFENSCMLLSPPCEDPKKLYQDAQKKCDALMKEFDEADGWCVKVSKFNDFIDEIKDKKIESYIDKIKMIEEHCENFLKMRAFISDLFEVLRAYENYLKMLPSGKEQDALKHGLSALIQLVDKLLGNVIELHGFMRDLAVECEKNNNEHMTESMRDFMRPWVGAMFTDEEALVQSVRVKWEAELEEEFAEVKESDNSLSK